MAFQLAISFPEVIIHMIAHEAPSNNLLPEPLCSEVTDGLVPIVGREAEESEGGPAGIVLRKALLVDCPIDGLEARGVA